MPIAIYRHLKLSVAIPRQIRPAVLNFHPRRLRGLCIDQEKDGRWIARLGFSHLWRRHQLRINNNVLWHFENGEFTIYKSTTRNGSVVSMNRGDVVPPAFTTVWTENGSASPIHRQFEEEEVTSRVAIERYLHQHVPNPYDFKIVIMDFDPKKMILGRPQYMSHQVREPGQVAIAAYVDRSEDAKQWAQLFFS
jgi:hypothetical protein